MKPPPPEVEFITFLQAADHVSHFQQVDDAGDLNQGLHVQFNLGLH